MNNFLKTLSFILLSSGTLFILILFGLKIFFQKNMNNDLIILGPEKEEVISIPKDKGGLKVSNLDIEILNNKSALEINEKIRPLPTKPELLPIEIPETNKSDLKKSESIKKNKTITLKKSDDIKSAVGIGLDWFSPIGPMNFTLSQHLSKGSNDVTESFRFNLGTTF